MKSLLKRGALSARPEATIRIKSGIVHSGTLGLAITVLTLLLSSCDGNNQGHAAGIKEHPTDSLPSQGLTLRSTGVMMKRET